MTTYLGESKYGNPFMWTGQAFDQNTRQYHFWARAYSPHLGRWLQRDPLGYVDGVGLYEYAISDPVGFVDPAGLRIDKVVVYLPRSGFYRVYLHVYDSQGNYLDTVVIKNPNDDHEVAEAEQVAHWIETGGLISDGADIAETAAYASLFVGGLFIPGPDDAIWALVLGEQGIQLVAKGAGYVLVRGGKVLSELEARLALRGAAGKVEKLAAKRGPKPWPTGAHNQKIAQRIKDLKKKLGPDWEHVGGGNLKEEVVKTMGGAKSSRRPDITFRNTKTGEVYREQVGRTTRAGDPVAREVDALDDLQRATGARPPFTPCD